MEVDPEKFAAVLVISQIVASVMADHLDEECLQVLRKKMKSYQWEQAGQTYQQYFHIKKWKSHVPELGNQFCKDHLQGNSKEHLNRFVLETIRAELCHEIALVLAIPLILGADPSHANWAIPYSALANIPFIMIQRYNRPRLEKLLEKNTKGVTETVVPPNPSPIRSR